MNGYISNFFFYIVAAAAKPTATINPNMMVGRMEVKDWAPLLLPLPFEPEPDEPGEPEPEVELEFEEEFAAAGFLSV